MSPATARTVRRARVRQLAQDEPELSLREVADRLGISKDTVRRDLEAMAQDDTAPVAHTAPQVTAGGAEQGETPGAACDTGTTGGAATDAPGATAATLPRRIAPGGVALDLSQWPELRRDLALLAQTGRSAEALVRQAVTALAFGYRTALARDRKRHV